MAKRKLFVWDLHGVLEKGNDVAVVFVTNEVLKKHAYKERLSLSDALKLVRRKWFEYFSFLLPNETSEKHFQLQKESFIYSEKYFQKFSHMIKLNDFAEEVLESIDASCHDQILISNTQQKSLEQYVSNLKIEKHFPKDRFWGVAGHSVGSRSKQDFLDNFLKTNDNFDMIVTIGDSKRDVELAKGFSRGKSYLYSHPNIPFSDCIADEKIQDLRLVLKEL